MGQVCFYLDPDLVVYAVLAINRNWCSALFIQKLLFLPVLNGVK